jgi:hypothetical protein
VREEKDGRREGGEVKEKEKTHVLPGKQSQVGTIRTTS